MILLATLAAFCFTLVPYYFGLIWDLFYFESLMIDDRVLDVTTATA